MGRDILFKTDEFVFSLRVGGILRHKDRVLLQCPPGTEEYAIIGGHISAMETAAETLVREFREEIHADITVGELLCSGEVFFLWGNRPCHQICFYYEVELKEENAIPMESVFHGFDELDNIRVDLDYCWVPVEKIKAGLTVYPQEIVPYLIDKDRKNGHFLSRER